MGIPLLEGRDFTVQDDASHPPGMIVTREFARRFVGSGSVVGRKVRGWGKWFTIVGVAEDTKIHRLTESALPYFCASVRQIYRPEMGLAFFVRTSGSVKEALAVFRREAQALNGMVPISDVTSLKDYIGVSLFAQRIAASLLSVLAGIAFLLASIGLYGVMAYAVAQYGLARIRDHFRAPGASVDTLLEDVRRFGGGTLLQDDATVAIVEATPQ